MNNNDRYKKGLDIIEKISGNNGINAIKHIESISPDFANMIVSFGYGELYSRESISLREREFITISSLITQGAFEQLKFHIPVAINLGISSKEIVEIIIHCAGYAGFPKACQAIIIATDIFETMGIDYKKKE